MPILYHFHILLATFYMIYWTDLLILFFVSQKIHIKWSPNAIKFYKELFWNICDFWELESSQTEAHTHHKTLGHGPGARRVVVGCAHLVRRLGLYFGHREAYIRKKIVIKSQRNRCYGSAEKKERVFALMGETRNSRKQGGRPNLGGPPPPPPPWRPRTRGGTLLPI